MQDRCHAKCYIDAQNLLYSSRDRIKARLAELYRILPRSYGELRMHMELMQIGLLIEAIERASGKPRGNEEGEAMRTYIRIQLSTEYQKGYSSFKFGAQVATSTSLNDMRKENEACRSNM